MIIFSNEQIAFLSLTLLAVFQKWDTPFIDWILTTGLSRTHLCSYWKLMQMSDHCVHTATLWSYLPCVCISRIPNHAPLRCCNPSQGFIIVSKCAYQISYHFISYPSNEAFCGRESLLQNLQLFLHLLLKFGCMVFLLNASWVFSAL